MADFPLTTLNSECSICKIPLDFGNINQSKEKVLMINYYDILTNNNRVVITCSDECEKEFNKSDAINHQGCIVCKSFCIDDKWNFDLKFINQGGWTSSKFMCSEKCRKEFFKEIKKDEELNPCYQCAFCKNYTKNSMKKCSKCRIAYYCNLDCQKSDWANHKINCK